MNTQKISKQNSNSENTELITKEQIEGTPFHIIGTEEGFFGCIGKYRITELAESKDTIKDELLDMNWNRIVQVILILIENQK